MKLRRIVPLAHVAAITMLALPLTLNAQTVVTADEPVAPSQLQNRDVEVAPVVVSPGMEPRLVPNSNRSVQLDGAEGLAVDGASTGNEGSNTGSQNTGGVQVQNVTVQANPEMDQASGAYNTVDALRKRRGMVEQDNESRLLEKIEEDRLRDERHRSNSIESFEAQNGHQINAPIAIAQAEVQTVPVVAPMHGDATAGVEGKFDVKKKDSGTKFAITPFGGKRYIDDGYAQFSAYNNYMFGLALEGRIGKYFAVEGNFTYGEDEFEYNGPQYYHYQGQNLQGNMVRTRESYEFGSNLVVGPNHKKFRPYGLVGIGVMYQKYHIDDPYTEAALESIGWQRATTNIYSNFGGGVEYRFTDNFGIGGRVDYQYVYGKDENYYNSMDYIWGDVSNRVRGTINANIVF